MCTPLNSAQLQHLIDFIGYGRLDAPVWFIGMEEGGGGAANINARLNFQPVEDLRHAHVNLLKIPQFHYNNLRTNTPIIQPTWDGMCRIMLGLHGISINPPAIRNYQADCLGRDNASTMLCELMPIPCPNMNVWPQEYQDLFPQYPTKKDYYDDVMPKRIKAITQLIKQYEPKIVICYGAGYWIHYKKLFPNFPSFSQPPGFVGFEAAQFNNMIVILIPHFVAIPMNGYTVQQVATYIKQQMPQLQLNAC